MQRWFGTGARVVVAGVWIAAGVLKLPDPAASVRAVRAFQLLPDAIEPTVGYLLPAVEIVLGLFLLSGLLTRAAGVVSFLLFAGFVVGIASAWARGLQIDCGCFGGGGTSADAASDYPWEMARDAGLMLLSAWLVWRPRTRFALDNLLFEAPDGPEQPHDPTADARIGHDQETHR